MPLFFHPKIDKAQAAGKIRSAISSKGWKRVYIEEQKLFFVPTWFFNYYIFWEKTNEQGEKIVSSEKRGFAAMDSSTSEFSEWLFDLSQNASSFSSQDTLPITIESTQVPSKLKQETAKEIATAGLAVRNAAAKQNVLILDMALFFVPIWGIKGRVEDYHFAASIEAVNGKILFEKDVPFREKTKKEIMNESFNHITNPLAWLDFSKRTIHNIIRVGSKTLQDYDTATLILLGVLIIVALWALGFF